MKYIIRNQDNEVFLKLNSVPQNPYSGTYKWTCTHIQSSSILTLILDDESAVPNTYQKFSVASADSRNFLVGQYNVDIYDITGGTKITTEVMTAQDSGEEDAVYFMANSNTANIYETSTTSIPDAPVSLSATLQSGGLDIKLAWELGSTNTDSYDVWRKTGTGGTYINLNSDVQSFNLTDTNLSGSTTYYYKIRAYNEIGYSSFSSEVSTTTAGSGTTDAVILIGSGSTTTDNVSGNTWVIYSSGGTGGDAVWGGITGTLSGQTDLQNALDAKIATSLFDTYTGDTLSVLNAKPDFVDFIGSGGTTVTATGGTVTIYSTVPTGTTVSWGDVVGTLSNQSDLQTALNLKVDKSLYDSDLLILANAIDSNTTGITANTASIDTKLNITDYESYTGTTQTTLQNLQTGLTNTTSIATGNTVSIGTKLAIADQYITGATASGGTILNMTDKVLTIFSPTGGTAPAWGDITGTLSGQTDLQTALDLRLDTSVYNADMLIVSAQIDANEAAITGNTAAIALKLNTSVFNTYTGDTATAIGLKASQADLDTHTGDTSIHFTQAQITGLTTSTMFDTYTGDTETAIGLKLNVADQYITGATASGGTVLDLTNKVLTIYSPTGGTGGSASLSGLTDTTITSITTGDVLQWTTGDTWSNIPPVDITANVSEGQALIVSGTTIVGADKQDLNATITGITAAVTIDATYAGKIIEASGTFTITLPDSMDNGMRVDIVNVGTGVITIAASTTLQSKDSAVTLASQYGGGSVYHRGSNVWALFGDLT